jgi:hypothetical protein
MAAFLLTGCEDYVSLYPLYDDRTLTVEPPLTGSWRTPEGDVWTFVPSDGRKYRLTVTSSSEETFEFEAGLIELSRRLFLDLCGKDSGTTGAPAHAFARIQFSQDPFEGNLLEVAWLNGSWMKQRLEEERHLTQLPSSHGRTILTAPTADLQEFFRRHAWDERAFSADTK